jgi:hypothetical protein
MWRSSASWGTYEFRVTPGNFPSAATTKEMRIGRRFQHHDWAERARIRAANVPIKRTRGGTCVRRLLPCTQRTRVKVAVMNVQARWIGANGGSSRARHPRKGNARWLIAAALTCGGRILGAAVLLPAIGCSGKSDRVPSEPVPECVEYEKTVASCFHRPLAIANQPSLIPKTRGEREQIRALCTQNLNRIQSACR